MDATELKESISMQDVCSRYGIEVNSKGFAICPFHSEKTASMRIYPGHRGFCCFGCGESGDIIHFVEKYFNIPFHAAVSKLALDFGLVTAPSKRISIIDVQRQGRAEWERKRQKQREKKAAEEIEANYWKTFDAYIALEDFVKEHAALMDDDPRFSRAVRLLATYAEELEYADMRRRELDRTYNNTTLHTG